MHYVLTGAAVAVFFEAVVPGSKWCTNSGEDMVAAEADKGVTQSNSPMQRERHAQRELNRFIQKLLFFEKFNRATATIIESIISINHEKPC